MSWNASKYAESYDVYRSSSYSSGFAKVASGLTSTSWTDKAPLAGSNYYRIVAAGHGMTSSYSNTRSVVNYALDAPTNVTASITNDFLIRVSWNTVKYAESYDVYRSSSYSSGFTKVASSLTSSSWTDKTPLEGNNYYRVVAVGHGLASPYSNTSNVVSYALDAPTNVKATLTNDFLIKVSWNVVKDAEAYEVYRSSSSSSGFKKIAEGVTATTWTDKSPLSGSNYYRIVAVGHGLTSPASNATTVVNYALDAPTNVTASITNDFFIRVSWNAVEYAEAYEVYRSNSSSSGFTKVAEGITATTWTDKSPLAGNNYYRVCAVGHGLTSPASKTSNAVNYALDAPTNVTASIPDDDFVIRVSWDAVKDAEAYEVYRSNISSSGFTKVAEGITSTTWTDNTPLEGNNYYRVCAVGHGLTSPASNTSSVVNYVLAAPTNVTATIISDFSIRVSWNSVRHAETYDVYRSNSSSSGFTKVAEGITATTWVDKSPLADDNYYRVCAVGHGMISPASSTSNVAQGNVFNVNGVEIKMVKVEGGTFKMGLSEELISSSYYDIDRPDHEVTLSDYYICDVEVTQALWKTIMGRNPSYFQGDKLPVESVSWDDCQEFIMKLNEQTGMQFRLPTEAEWEFAARRGNESAWKLYSRKWWYSGGDSAVKLDDVSWYSDNSNGHTHEVATKAPNDLGLYDMSGNVGEWCQDWYGNYSSDAQTNPTGPSSGSDRVVRGGWFSGYWEYCMVFHRYYSQPSEKSIEIGLRLAHNAP